MLATSVARHAGKHDDTRNCVTDGPDTGDKEAGAGASCVQAEKEFHSLNQEGRLSYRCSARASGIVT